MLAIQKAVRINPRAKNILMTYAKIHSWSMARLLDTLAQLLVVGLDGIETFDLETLKELYMYSSFQIVADLRKVTK